MPGELRLMSVHAHADDESITMGAGLAQWSARGVRLCNVCCTDGELATIVAKDMPEETTRPRLGEIRREELRRACRALGVERVEFLGYHDSGMAGTETARRPEAFAMQPIDAVVDRLVRLIRDFRPHVVVTYDGNGGYGHPDHIQTHRATLLAVEAAHLHGLYPEDGQPWRVSKLSYTVIPRSVLQRVVDVALAAGMDHPFEGRDVADLEFAADDDSVSAIVDVREGIGPQREALLAHRSQIDETFPLLSVPEEVMRELFGNEHYQLVLTRVPVTLPESDLFAGIDPDAPLGATALTGAVAVAGG